MIEDLARVAVGAPVAVLLPLTVPGVRDRPKWVGLLAALYAAYALAPILPEWEGWVILVAATALAAGLSATHFTSQDPTVGKGPTSAQVVPLIAAICFGLLTALLLEPKAVAHAIDGVISDNGIAVVASLALAAIFVGGAAVAAVLSPFTAALEERGEDIPSLKSAGTIIGWCERALFFAFLVGGQPQAAAVALAAKSFARFPSLGKHQEGFAEYFLIGTLASLVVALVAAVVARVALGLDVF